jgi:hypothetical protein
MKERTQGFIRITKLQIMIIMVQNENLKRK